MGQRLKLIIAGGRHETRELLSLSESLDCEERAQTGVIMSDLLHIIFRKTLKSAVKTKLSCMAMILPYRV
jgi:hypothetical protein